MQRIAIIGSCGAGKSTLMIYTACYQLLVAMRKMRAALIWNLVFTLIFGISIFLVIGMRIY